MVQRENRLMKSLQKAIRLKKKVLDLGVSCLGNGSMYPKTAFIICYIGS